MLSVPSTVKVLPRILRSLVAPLVELVAVERTYMFLSLDTALFAVSYALTSEPVLPPMAPPLVGRLGTLMEPELVLLRLEMALAGTQPATLPMVTYTWEPEASR